MNTLYMYVLTEISWDYNDEYYTRSESDGGTPILVSSREDLLATRAKDLTLGKIRNCCLADYYDTWDGEVHRLCDSFGIDMRDYLEANLSEELVAKIYDLDPSHFYRVDKVELY